MPRIHITTMIHAPVEVVFDLSRNISLHKLSQRDHQEEAIAGVTSGCINIDETVTWKAKHFFRTRFMQVKITAMQKPVYFCDEQVKGDFKSFRHEHHFKSITNGTIMIDILDFETKQGFIGRVINALFLTRYLKNLIDKRNETIRLYAESDKWKALLR